MKYDTVIFDLDGTLLNTLEDLADSVNYALRELNMPERTYDQVRRFVGNGIMRLMELAVPEGKDNPQFDRAFEIFKAHYGENCNNKTRLYPQAEEIVDALEKKGYKMAVVSNKYDPAVKELIKQYFGDRIPVAIGERTGVRRKPAPDTVFTALEELRSSRNTSVYIGDSDVDVMTAKNAGMDCISVLWGFRDRKCFEDAGATMVAETAQEVLKYIGVED